MQKQKRYLLNLLLALIFSGCVAPSQQNSDTKMLGGGANSYSIKQVSKIPNLKLRLAESVRKVKNQPPKAKVRKVLSKTLIDGLIQDDSDIPLLKMSPNSYENHRRIFDERESLLRILKEVVISEEYPRLSELEPQATSQKEVQIDNSAIQLSYMLMSDLIIEAHTELDQLRAESPSLKRIAEIEGLLNTIEFGMVPLTPPNSTFDKRLERKSNGEVDLSETLSKARLINSKDIIFSRNPISPTPSVDLMSVLSKSDAELVDSMGSGYFYFAKGAVKASNEIMGCVLSAMKIWADCTRVFNRFNAILNKSDLPRVSGEVFRGLHGVPSKTLEQWLTLASRGQPLYLGINNTPEASFASRSPEIAIEYLYDRCGNTSVSTDSYDVLLVISQRTGVSVEKILTRDYNLNPVIISNAQKFKITEILKTERRQRIVIKLEEI